MVKKSWSWDHGKVPSQDIFVFIHKTRGSEWSNRAYKRVSWESLCTEGWWKRRKDGQCEHSIYRRLEPGSEKNSSSSRGQMNFSDSKHTEIRVLSKRSSAKDTQTHCIYSLKCGTCEYEYVGETLRAIGVRAKEHRDAVSTGDHKKISTGWARPII